MDDDIEELVLTVIHLQPPLDSGKFHAPVLVLGSLLNLANGMCKVQIKTIQQRFQSLFDKRVARYGNHSRTLW